MAESNPNGANQWVSDPRQKEFLLNYLNPKSETWSNGLQSAIKAGYTEEYAKVMLARDLDWLSESVNDDKMVKKATRNLDMALDGLLDDPEKGGKPLQLKATEITLKGLQKGKWSERKELGGIDGKDLIPSVESKEVVENAFKEI